MTESVGYIAPARTASRVADQLLDQYLKTKPGTRDALRLLAESRKAAKQNLWDFPSSPDTRLTGSKRLHELTEKELDQICELYLNGETVAEICKRFQTNHNAVYRLLTLRQIERKHPGRGRRCNVDVTAIYKLQDAGVCIKEIARRLKCHHSTVKSRLAERVSR